MRAVVQRVSEARVVVTGEVVAEIGSGLCVLLGVADADLEEDGRRLAGKVARLRIFENEQGKFDRSLLDVGGAALVVSEFTLIADTAKETARASPMRRGPRARSRSTNRSARPSPRREWRSRAASSAPA